MSSGRRLNPKPLQGVIAASVFVLAALASLVPASAASSGFSAQSASNIVALTRAAMAAAGSVTASAHGIGTASGGGKVEIRELDYTAATSGTQQFEITSRSGSSANQPSASTLDIGGRVYVDANAAFWVSSAGLSTTQAAAVAMRWVQVRSANPFYASAASDLTMPSLVADLFNSKEFHKGRIVSVNGMRAISISYTNAGYDPGPAVCDVALGGKHLPVAFTLGGITFHLTSWGKTKTVAPPIGAIPLPSTSSGGQATT